MITFKNFIHKMNLFEDRFSPTRKKALFVIGSPASGKSFIAGELQGGLGLKPIDSDIPYEFLMQKHGMSMNNIGGDSSTAKEIRGKAIKMREQQLEQYAREGHGLILPMVGDKPEKVQQKLDFLRQRGYDSHMLVVNTSDEKSKERNETRGNMPGGRAVPEPIRAQIWRDFQNKRETYRQMFGDSKYNEIDNSEDLSKTDKSAIEAHRRKLVSLFVHYKKLLEKRPMNENEHESGESDHKTKKERKQERKETIRHRKMSDAEANAHHGKFQKACMDNELSYWFGGD